MRIYQIIPIAVSRPIQTPYESFYVPSQFLWSHYTNLNGNLKDYYGKTTTTFNKTRSFWIGFKFDTYRDYNRLTFFFVFTRQSILRLVGSFSPFVSVICFCYSIVIRITSLIFHYSLNTRIFYSSSSYEIFSRNAPFYS